MRGALVGILSDLIKAVAKSTTAGSDEGSRAPRRPHSVKSEAALATPGAAKEAVSDWERSGRPEQKPIPWPQSEWIKAFPELEPMLSSMSNPLDRDHVRKTVASQSDDEDGAVAAFVACMAWGYGRTGYGRTRTRNVLQNNHNAPEKLSRARDIATKGGLRAAFEAYKFLSDDGRLEGLGPAFGTKFIHFHNRDGLILDKLTGDWFRRASGVDLHPTRWDSSKYREYLAFMGGWAEDLCVSSDQLEEIAFSQISRERGNQWT